MWVIDLRLDHIAAAELTLREAEWAAKRQRCVEQLARQTAHRDLLRGRLSQEAFWVKADGTRLAISAMTPGHAGRAAAMLRRSVVEIAGKLSLTSEEVLASPIYAALDKRAAEAATWTERRQDKKSYKKWQASNGVVRETLFRKRRSSSSTKARSADLLDLGPFFGYESSRNHPR